MNKISLNGIELAFEDIGGGPAVLLIHGHPFDHTMWKAQCEPIASLERPDYSDVLQRFECPALIVIGDEDVFTTRADAERMHALLKDSRLLWLHGVGHMPNLEHPEGFNAALARFLARLA
jgi:pimeloyl-ACP methyl ester carboxylesterase